MKAKALSVKQHENFIIKAFKDFFNPYQAWGRQNRNQFIIGIFLVIIYFLSNSIITAVHPSWNPFTYTSNGLLITAFVCAGLVIGRYTASIFNFSSNKYPWYEKYMPMIISLLGLVTLMALQNLGGTGVYDASLWINISVLFVIFIIAAGYFVEGSNSEKIIKIWFSLLGYFFSVIVVFYFLDRFLETI